MDTTLEKQSTKIIARAADCNINRFMACMFDNDRKALIVEGDPTIEELNEAWETINIEFLDGCGYGTSYETRLLAKISEYEIRIEVVRSLVQLQRQSIAIFGCPHPEALQLLNRRASMRLVWDDIKRDKEDFIEQLNKCEIREKTYNVRLECALSELAGYREEQKRQQEKKGHISAAKSRKNFITTLIILQKHDYVINREVTTVEELSLMINTHNKQVKEAHEAQQKTARGVQPYPFP